ncbi:hypothetical protein Tco_1470616, partial [Tanacetum coccineum]
ESRCYRYTLDVQRRSQDVIVVHEMFNRRFEMLSLYMRCSTNESRSLGKIALDVDFFMKRETSPSTNQFSWSFIDSKLFSSAFNTFKLIGIKILLDDLRVTTAKVCVTAAKVKLVLFI